jgi:hypothetical protein
MLQEVLPTNGVRKHAIDIEDDGFGRGDIRDSKVPISHEFYARHILRILPANMKNAANTH